MSKLGPKLRTAASACPWCGTVHDAVTGMGSTPKPKPGDLSICIECGEWAVYETAEMRRKPTVEERFWIAANVDCRRVEIAWGRSL